MAILYNFTFNKMFTISFHCWKVVNSLIFNRVLQLYRCFYTIWNTASIRNKNDAFKKNLLSEKIFDSYGYIKTFLKMW